ncbi:MAG: 4Fe-4S dicluster domain-containing protein [Treponemataceae bacterium]|nr:4Fe-4S dicluster domain-containing protein [Treponemataceae bacterium]
MVSIKEISRFQDKKYNSHSIAFLPSLAVVSLTQDSKTHMESIVQKGDYVEEGQVIAKNSISNEIKDEKTNLPAYIHSPVPGKVLDIYNVINPNGKKLPAVLIRMEGNFSFSGKKRDIINWTFSNSITRIKTLSQMGVINTFEKPISLAQQLDEIVKNKENKSIAEVPPLVIRLFDTDPDTVIDKYITENFAKEVFEGAAILANTIDTRDVIFISEKNTWNLPEENEIKKYFGNIKVHSLETDIDVYPRGQYKYINQKVISFLKSKGINNYKDSFAIDSSTSLDVYNAIAKSYPAIDRFIQVEGDDIAMNGIFKIRIGTTFRNLFEECNGFIKEPAKIIINGLINGIAISDLDTPITRYVKSIFVLSSRSFPDQRQTACIRCGRCHNICPENLHPEKLYSNYYSDTPVQQYILDTIKLCTECGLCNTICPSRIPLCQTIQLIKDTQ